MGAHLYKKYIWLVDTIHRHGPITFAQIKRRWAESSLSEGNPLALRTFHNHREAVEELFMIRIACDERTNAYYIDEQGELGKNGLSSWLLNSFSMNNLLQESQSLSGRVLVEEIPSAQHHLTDLLTAMREQQMLEIRYHRFDTPQAAILELQPLFVKLNERRWYLYAKKADDDRIKVYALDRMEEVKLLEKHWELPADFDPQEIVRHTWGVAIYDSIKPCEIRLRAYGWLIDYLRTLPLHRSQREVVTADTYSDFDYYTAPTQEFFNTILRYGAQIEILSPAEVRQELIEQIEAMQLRYSLTKK